MRSRQDLPPELLESCVLHGARVRRERSNQEWLESRRLSVAGMIGGRVDGRSNRDSPRPTWRSYVLRLGAFEPQLQL